MKKTTMINRREFVSALGVLGGASLLSPWSCAPKDITITRIVQFEIRPKRPKYVGKNSHLDDHTEYGYDRAIRVFTSAGIEGLGYSREEEEVLQALIGKSLNDCWNEDKTAVNGFGVGTTALWDIRGKLEQKPIYELLGAGGTFPVPAYDGTIYFQDLLPQHASNYLDRFREEMDMGLERGHRAFKIKVGRGYKWMEPQAGFDRDVEVLNAIRAHVGPDIILGVDSNNGYTLESAKQLLESTPDFNYAFVEEMFPETVEDCLAFKEFIREGNYQALLADGESHKVADTFEPYTDAEAMDVLQGDMNRFGIEGIMKEAAMGGPHNIRIAPHNWGSLIGYFTLLHIGRAVPNFYAAENDFLTSEAIITDGFGLNDGKAYMPDKPGLGLEIDEAGFEKDAKILLDLKG